MPELDPHAAIPQPPAGKPHCPKCDAAMSLAHLVRVASGSEIRTFDCINCDHAHIVTVAAVAELPATSSTSSSMF
jgi:hypothetical protein